MILKSLLLSTMLLVAPGTGGESDKVPTANRQQVKAECIAQAPDTYNERTVKAVCECFVQFISASTTENSDRYADFTIAEHDPLLGVGIPACLDIAGQVGPEKFFEEFESLEAGAGDDR